jgi:hypothetical protein
MGMGYGPGIRYPAMNMVAANYNSVPPLVPVPVAVADGVPPPPTMIPATTPVMPAVSGALPVAGTAGDNGSNE